MCVVQSKCKMEEKLRILFIIGQITLKGLNAYYINNVWDRFYRFMLYSFNAGENDAKAHKIYISKKFLAFIFLWIVFIKQINKVIVTVFFYYYFILFVVALW